MSSLESILGRGNVTYHIAVAEACGSVAAAIFLEQIAFWQVRSEDGWAFRSVEQIKEYTGLKKDAQQGARKLLLGAGVLEEELRGMPARNYYRIDLDKLALWLEGTRQQAAGNPPLGRREPANRSIEGVESKEKSSLERDAGASHGPNEEVKTNWFTLYCDRMKEVGLPTSPEDRRRLPGNLRRCYENEGATDQEMHRLISRIVTRQLEGYTLSPQAALKDIRGIPRTNGKYQQSQPAIRSREI